MQKQSPIFFIFLLLSFFPLFIYKKKMSLVPDYSSSDSESDNESINQVNKRSLSSILPKPKKTKLIHVELPKLQDDEEDTPKPVKSLVGLGLADLLPAPKNSKQVNKSTTSFMPHSLSRKGKEKQIDPVEKEQEQEQEEEEEEHEEETYTPNKYTGSFFHIGNNYINYKSNIILKSFS